MARRIEVRTGVTRVIHRMHDRGEWTAATRERDGDGMREGVGDDHVAASRSATVKNYDFAGYDELTPEQARQLIDACDRKLADYVTKRGDAIWEHRRAATGYLSGTLKYEVLKA